MLSEIKLQIIQNDKVIDTVVRNTNTKPAELVKSLEEFQQAANAALTKIIEAQGSSGIDMEEEENGEEEDEEDDETPVSPKKRKK